MGSFIGMHGDRTEGGFIPGGRGLFVTRVWTRTVNIFVHMEVWGLGEGGDASAVTSYKLILINNKLVVT